MNEALNGIDNIVRVDVKDLATNEVLRETLVFKDKFQI